MLKKPRQKWKVLPDFPKYEINQYGDVRYVETKARLTRKEQFGRQYYHLQDSDNIVWIRHMHELLATVPAFSF